MVGVWKMGGGGGGGVEGWWVFEVWEVLRGIVGVWGVTGVLGMWAIQKGTCRVRGVCGMRECLWMGCLRDG